MKIGEYELSQATSRIQVSKATQDRRKPVLLVCSVAGTVCFGHCHVLRLACMVLGRAVDVHGVWCRGCV